MALYGLRGLRHSVSDVGTSEDVSSVGLDALRELARTDPQGFVQWKSANPKAYVPGQPMVVGGEVFDVSNQTQGAPYLGALARQRADRKNAEINALSLGNPNRESLQRSQQAEIGPGLSRDFGLFDEAQHAIANNSGREAVFDSDSLNLPDSETGLTRAPRRPRNSPNAALTGLLAARDWREQLKSGSY